MMELITPRVLTVQYRLTTPMFLGGEGQQADSQQFRNASYKGALRFWWRALNWGRVLKAAPQGNQAAALKILHDEEGRLFGIASDGKNSRQSLVQITSEFNASQASHSTNDGALDDVVYLLGLGLWSNNTNGPAGHKGVQRDYIKAGATVRVQLSLSSRASAEQIAQIRAAATALGLFGGLGSRARKGFGSLAIQQLVDIEGKQHHFANKEDIATFVRDIDCSAPADAPLTAFTKATRIDISEKGKNPLTVLRTVCQQLQAYRDGTVGRSARLNSFPGDRQLARAAQQGETIANLPERAVFGLPHNYQWKEQGNPKLDIAPSSTERNRRASPLFIHIHEFSDQTAVAVQVLLPTVFLPVGTQITLKSSIGRNSRTMPVPEMNYGRIHAYLNDHFPSKEVLRRGE